MASEPPYTQPESCFYLRLRIYKTGLNYICQTSCWESLKSFGELYYHFVLLSRKEGLILFPIRICNKNLSFQINEEIKVNIQF